MPAAGQLGLSRTWLAIWRSARLSAIMNLNAGGHRDSRQCTPPIAHRRSQPPGPWVPVRVAQWTVSALSDWPIQVSLATGNQIVGIAGSFPAARPTGSDMAIEQFSSRKEIERLAHARWTFVGVRPWSW